MAARGRCITGNTNIGRIKLLSQLTCVVVLFGLGWLFIVLVSLLYINESILPRIKKL